MTQAVAGAAQAASPPRTAPLVVLFASWDRAVRYATSPGHLAKPRVARELGDEGARWAVFTQVSCGAVAPAMAAREPRAPRATGPDPVDFWRLLRAR